MEASDARTHLGPAGGRRPRTTAHPGHLAGYARKAERLGFAEVWVAEDCFLHGAFAQAATILASTTSPQVGMGIIPAAARNVAFAAMEIATLAGMRPGWLAVGVGHGMPGWLDQAGAQPSSPLTLLEEYIQALRWLLAGQRVDYAGHYVRLSGVQLSHAPPVFAGVRGPPVFAGVRGPRSLRLSSKIAQGTILAEPVTPEYLSLVAKQVNSRRSPGHRPAGRGDAEPDDRCVRAGFRVIGDDVARGAGLAAADGQHRGLGGRDLPG